MYASKAIVALAALAASVAASAATLDPIAFDITTNGDLVKTNWTRSATGSRFDPALGTLTGVSIVIDWTGKLGGLVTNKSAEANTVEMRYGLTMKVRENVSNFVLASSEVASATETKQLAVGGAATFGAYEFEGAYTFSTSDSSILNALFVGTGAIGVNVRAEGAGTQLAASGPIQTSVNTFAGAKGVMTYTYTPEAVPEPASMAALGLGALAMIRRRKLGGAK